MRRVGLVFAVVGAMLLGIGPMGRAEAQEGPSATVAPSTQLTDGQTVTVTASGFLAISDPRVGTIVPEAFQCPAGLAPDSATSPLDLEAALEFLRLLDARCDSLGSFPPASGTTTRSVVVHTTVTTETGGTLRCGVTAGDCAIVVFGVTNSIDLGVASVPISFGPDVPTSRADCKDGGWRNLANDQGQPFRSKGQCVRYVVARRR